MYTFLPLSNLCTNSDLFSTIDPDQKSVELLRESPIELLPVSGLPAGHSCNSFFAPHNGLIFIDRYFTAEFQAFKPISLPINCEE